MVALYTKWRLVLEKGEIKMTRLPIPQLSEIRVLPPDKKTESRRNEFISILATAVRRRAMAEAKQEDDSKSDPGDN